MTHSAHGGDRLTLDGGPKPGTAGVRFGFFTDTSVCIGCKACEVACKVWNGVPATQTAFTGHSLDNTGALGADAWRHVAFIEQDGVVGRDPVGRTQAAEGGRAPGRTQAAEGGRAPGRTQAAEGGRAPGLEWFGDDPGLPEGAHGGGVAAPAIPVFHGAEAAPQDQAFRWLMSSDVCKHCTSAACLEVCPTGAIFTTEFSTVVVQDDVCNGCGYCVTACPYGVIERRAADGGAYKCTLCYDRMRASLQPACAKACPTDSIQFGPLDELRARAADRLDEVLEAGQPTAQLYGADPDDGVGGNGAFFLLLDDPEVYRLPPDPVTPTRNIAAMWKVAGAVAGALAAGVVAAFAGEVRR